jgi:ubiquinone/menaquinone biosynthesis C-methylase UbiE
MTDSGAERKAQTRANFDRLAPDYDVEGCFAYFGRRLVDEVGVEAGVHVLDVASGRGAVLFPAAEKAGSTGHVVGIDLSEGMVRATSDDASQRGIAAHLHVMDAENLAFPDASFGRSANSDAFSSPVVELASPVGRSRRLRTSTSCWKNLV